MKVGDSYLFHTHLGIWLGQIATIEPDEITLDRCSWIPDQGRMGECVKKGELVEIEFVGDGVIVPRTSVKVPWKHRLPTKSKP